MGTGRRTLNLLAVCCVTACSSSDLCTREVNAVHKLQNEFRACEPDGGYPGDSTASTEIASCQQQIVHCTPDEQKTIEASATCYEGLPAIDCSWFVPEGSGVNGGFQWGQQAYGCFPQGLSAACVVPALPPDGGYNF